MSNFLSAGPNQAAVISAVAVIIVALVTATAAYFASKRDRRRQLYGEAYKSALAWREMLYRVYRRREDGESEIIERFHDLQEQIDYYSGWIGSESRFMQYSYLRLIRHIKTTTGPLITEAWETQPTKKWRSLATGQHPDITVEAERFLRDVRGHLSPLQVRKLMVIARNSKRIRTY